MSLQLYTNNANTTLAASITSTATALSVVGGTGQLFPNPGFFKGRQQFFTFTLVKNGTPTVYEICTCSQRSTDTFSTITRAQEGTTALNWNAGDFVYIYPTAGGMAGMAQFDDLQLQSGNYAVDTGAANSYVVTLSPAPATLPSLTGVPIRFLAGHSNTTTSTLTVNGFTAGLVTQDNANLSASVIETGGIYQVLYNGSNFVLTGTQILTAYLTVAAAAATYETIAAAAALAPLNSPALTGDPTAPTAPTSSTTNQIANCAFVQNVCNGVISQAANGYEVRPTGMIDMWGTVAFSGVSPQNVTFPTIAGEPSAGFPTACLSIAIVPIASGGTTVESFGLAAPPTSSKTGFTLNSGSGLGFTWRAIGY